MKKQWTEVHHAQAANTAWLMERRRRRRGLTPNPNVRPWRAIRNTRRARKAREKALREKGSLW